MLGQLVRFGLVGVGNTALSLVSFRALISAGVPTPAAAAASFAVGSVNGYVWNRRWTFAADDTRSTRWRYLVVQVCALAAASATTWLLARAGVERLAAYALTIGVVTLAMFAANRAWTFPTSTRPAWAHDPRRRNDRALG
jgi:putative flippase GtrA